jgi:hypothetical protein
MERINYDLVIPMVKKAGLEASPTLVIINAQFREMAGPARETAL